MNATVPVDRIRQALALAAPDVADVLFYVVSESYGRASQPFTVNEVYRPLPEQVSIFLQRYTTVVLPGRPQAVWNGKRYYLKPGEPLAAVPGASMHGTTDDKGNPAAKAGDIGCLARDNGIRIELIKEAGGCTPVPGEGWHIEHRGNAAIPITAKEAKKLATLNDSPYINIPNPYGGGFWRLKKADGGIGFFGGAPDFGTMPGAGAKVVSPLVGLTPCVRAGVIIGYWIYDQAGHLYSFGKAPYFTSYAEHPEWSSPNSVIDGLVQTAGFEAGTQIRYCFTRFELGDREYYPDTYDIGREFAK